MAEPESCDAERDEAEATKDSRLRVDPSIAVFDLEAMFNKFFKAVGYRISIYIYIYYLLYLFHITYCLLHIAYYQELARDLRLDR